ncbi:MAG: nitrate reductase molybdenum cofactor assembly chaperone [Rhodoblastus sp.]
MLIFKVFSALLSYPGHELRAALPEIAAIVRASPLLGGVEQEEIAALICELEQGELLDLEESYVDLFDRGRALSLNLFEHLHGESRDRGSAMVELKQLYESAGFDLSSRELPDYLPVVLEYLSCRDMAEARDLVGDCAHILENIARGLIARQSRYGSVLQALLVIAGGRRVDAADVRPAVDSAGALDRQWAEQPAFGDDIQSRKVEVV